MQAEIFSTGSTTDTVKATAIKRSNRSSVIDLPIKEYSFERTGEERERERERERGERDEIRKKANSFVNSLSLSPTIKQQHRQFSCNKNSIRLCEIQRDLSALSPSLHLISLSFSLSSIHLISLSFSPLSLSFL